MRKDFRDFLARGNAFDLAVAVVIGAAFGAVVTSLVDDVIMQLIGALFGQPSFDAISIHWGERLTGEAEAAVLAKYPGLSAAYENQIFVGALLTRIVSFVIVAIALFLLVRSMLRLRRRAEEAPAEEPAGPTEVELLAEIRDALRR